MKLTDKQSKANAFVLERTEMIEKFVHKFCGRMNLDEYRQEVYFQVIRRHHSLRLEDALNREMVISTWLGWQCRAARKTIQRRRMQHEDAVLYLYSAGEDEVSPLDRLATTEAQDGHQDQMEHLPEIRRLLAVASREERIACVSILHGWTKQELRDHVDMAEEERDKHLRNLGRKAKETKHGPGLRS